jgi:hypothetical protein
VTTKIKEIEEDISQIETIFFGKTKSLKTKEICP